MSTINKLRLKARPYLMIAPAMAGIALFTIYPIIRLIYLSFMNINMLDKAQSAFVGLENYQYIFARPDFIKSLINTFTYTIAVVLIITAISLVMAVWLNGKKCRLNTIAQTFAFFPHIVSIVSASIIWLWMMEPNFGLFNYLLRSVGLPKVLWLTSSKTAMLSVIIVSVWKAVGYDMLIIMAALQGIPPELYEAASIDNANKPMVFFRITIPMISPQLFFILIVRTIASFKVFDTVRLLTGGGPNNATSTLVYMIYKEALYNMRIGYSAAIGVVLLILVGILTGVYFRILSKKVHYQ